MLTLGECADAMPDLQFAVARADAAEPMAQSASQQTHDLAGVGKLLFGLTLAQLGEGEDGLLEQPVTVSAQHRAGPRTGTLRLMSGDCELSVGDAVNLVFSTGDAACVLALQDFMESQGVDLLTEAQAMVAALGLTAIRLTGTEQGESWGEGLFGQTTCAATLKLMRIIGTPDDLPPQKLGPAALSVETRLRLHGWMGKVFEPSGLASALPGFGPNRVPHQTLSGWELTTRGTEHGYSSILTLPKQAGEWVHVAAHLPPSSAGPRSPREVSAVLGTLGLAAYRA